MWLLNRLAPDHKTISDFRRLNATPFKAVCRSFVRFCAEAELIGGQWVAIDGSKFQAVASKRSVVIASQLEQQLKSLDCQVQGYLESLDAADAAEGDSGEADKHAVREALARLQERRADVATTKAILLELEQTQHVVGEPEAKLMKTGDGSSAVAYNVQTAVDAKNKLVVHHELTNETNDQRSLLPMASGAKEALKADTLNVVADAGYSNGQQAQACEEAGITPYVPVKRSENNQDGGIYFDRSVFPPTMQAPTPIVARRANCFGARPSARLIDRCCTRPAHAGAVRSSRSARAPSNAGCRATSKKMRSNACASGLPPARAEMALAVLAYNFRRALNLLGCAQMRRRLAIQPA
jgi:hypothetical protein